MIGFLGIFTSMVILGFYAVVAGWCLQYLGVAVMGRLGDDSDYVRRYFEEFSTNPIRPCLWAVVFIGITHVVVSRGIRGGIERASRLLMPVLLVLLVIMMVAACMLPGAGRGIEFLLKPDFTKITTSVFLEALGQAFFSLSLGTACLCTYASYFSRETNLAKSAVQIALLDSLIAIMAGLIIFPAAYSVGIQPDSGPSLVFITLPNVFREAFAAFPVAGYVIAVMFYVLLVFAALTSTISMHEIGTAFFHEELKQPRGRAAGIVTVACSLIAIGCSLSVSDGRWQLFGLSLMNACDYLTAQLLLPLGAMLTSILLGWFVSAKLLRDELTNDGRLRASFFRAYLVSIRYVVPICILLVFLHQLGVV